MNHSLLERALTNVPYKLIIYLGLPLGIYVPYGTLQSLPKSSVYELIPTLIDNAILFEPRWIWAYLSICVLVPLAPAVCETKQQLKGYAYGLLIICIPSFIIFYIFPIAGPRPEIPPTHSVYHWLIGLDNTWNSLPSLHASLTVYSAGLLARNVSIDLARNRKLWVDLIVCTWAAIILYSTLATKQHWFWDIVAGVILGWLGYLLSGRNIAYQASEVED